MPKKPIIIGVTGGSGGGKTSVSRAILSNFPDEKIAMIEHDSYYKDQSHLTFEERVSTNYDHPFAFDTDLMIEHINELIVFFASLTALYSSPKVALIYSAAAFCASSEILVESVLK